MDVETKIAESMHKSSQVKSHSPTGETSTHAELRDLPDPDVSVPVKMDGTYSGLGLSCLITCRDTARVLCSHSRSLVHTVRKLNK
jgi:hypothetical protein